MTRFSARLRRVMDEQGATIRSVAAKSGLKEEEVYDYLRTRAVPKAERTRKIARALGCSVQALIPAAPPPKRYDPPRPLRPGPRTSRLLAKAAYRVPMPGELPSARAEPPLAKAERRQRALIYLLARKGVFTKEEWEAKLAEVIAQRRSG